MCFFSLNDIDSSVEVWDTPSIISLQYHEIEIEVELKDFHSMYQILKKTGVNTYDYTNYKLKSKKLLDVSLTCNYFLLDVDERKKFAQSQ